MSARAMVLLAVLASSFLAGCLNLEQPPLDRRLFTIDPVRSGRDAPVGPWADQGHSLRVLPFVITSRHADRSFTYRVGENEFQTDYYNAFAADPADLFTEQAVEWLDRSRVFQHVFPDDLNVRATHGLRAMIVDLYGDYANAESARAVVAVRFILTDEREGATEVALDALIRRSAPIEGEGPAAMAAALTNAYGQTLAELEERLRRAAPAG